MALNVFLFGTPPYVLPLTRLSDFLFNPLFLLFNTRQKINQAPWIEMGINKHYSAGKYKFLNYPPSWNPGSTEFAFSIFNIRLLKKITGPFD